MQTDNPMSCRCHLKCYNETAAQPNECAAAAGVLWSRNPHHKQQKFLRGRAQYNHVSEARAMKTTSAAFIRTRPSQANDISSVTRLQKPAPFYGQPKFRDSTAGINVAITSAELNCIQGYPQPGSTIGTACRWHLREHFPSSLPGKTLYIATRGACYLVFDDHFDFTRLPYRRFSRHVSSQHVI